MTVRSTSSPYRRLALGGVVLAVAAVGLSTVATGAWFTDTDTIGANTFTTGNVSLTTAPTATAITMAGMAPGSMVTSPITVTNNGSLALRYSVNSVTTEIPLAAELDLTIKSGVTACTNGGFATDGTSVYTTGVLGTTAAGTKLFGDVAVGQTGLVGAYGADRVLAAAGSEILCLQVLLPTTSGNAFEGLTTTTVLTFNSEQTINHP